MVVADMQDEWSWSCIVNIVDNACAVLSLLCDNGALHYITAIQYTILKMTDNYI